MIFHKKYKGYKEYDGNWSGDKMDGKGELLYCDGGKYKGDFKKDKPHGKGVFEYSTGEVFVGSFKDGENKVEGSFRMKDGKTIGKKMAAPKAKRARKN